MDDIHTSPQRHPPRLTADPSQEGILRIQEMERRLDEALESYVEAGVRVNDVRLKGFHDSVMNEKKYDNKNNER